MSRKEFVIRYNRAFVIVDKNAPALSKILDNTGEVDVEYWLVYSKESFHGHHDKKYFYFKDSRIERHTKLPLDCVKLEFSEEEINEKELDYKQKERF